ncbi:unnamed protein product [Linum trigynum]|uniref:Uncharacterized protein n=1 Tax=Linum trigynum TaxID=586398 RepID=A0AAV2CZ41_9ROSI
MINTETRRKGSNNIKIVVGNGGIDLGWAAGRHGRGKVISDIAAAPTAAISDALIPFFSHPLPLLMFPSGEHFTHYLSWPSPAAIYITQVK